MPYVFKHRRPPEPWRQFRTRAPHRIFVPLFMIEFVAEWAAFILSRWSFLEVLEYAGSFSVLIAVILYFAESGQRTQSRHYQAWQVINTAQGKGGSGGRIDALASLNDDHLPLVGVDVSGAFLEGVRLDGAELRRGNFRGADLKGSHLAGANLESAGLHFANLRESDLSRAIFRDADLSDADLVGAQFTGADFNGTLLDDADLSNADLSGIVNWQRCKSINRANIHGVRNPPDGFVAWAIQHHAVDEAPANDPTPSTQPATR